MVDVDVDRALEPNAVPDPSPALRPPEDRWLERLPGPAEVDPRRHGARRRQIERTLAIATPILFVAAWQATSVNGLIDEQLYPAPTTVWSAGVDLVQDGSLQDDVYVSLRRVLLGLLLGVSSGVAIGIVMGVSSMVRAALEPLLSALYTVPKLALLPLLLLIFGIGESPKVLVIAITVFFFMWISTMAAIMSVPEGYREAARSFGAGRWQLFRHALFPAALPQMFVALRISAGVAVLVMVGVEFVQATDGVGHLIWYSWTLFLAPRMYVGIVIVAVMGLIMTIAVQQAARRVVPWAEEQTNRGAAAGF